MLDNFSFISDMIQILENFFVSKQGILLVSIATLVSTIVGFIEIRAVRRELHEQDKKRSKNYHTARGLSIIGAIIGVVVGVIGLMPKDFSFPKVQGEIFFISIVVFFFAILIQRLINRESNANHFIAQLGNPKNRGFLPKEKRLAQMKNKHNPYACCPVLSENSAMFYGREKELQEILSVLCNPEKPGNVSILGEQHIGKSSLLNQIKQALAAEAKLVCIHTAHNWSTDSPAIFFMYLHQAICDALKIPFTLVNNYESFQKFIFFHAEKKYRFVLMIDEFELMTDNAHFENEFFGNIRMLGEQSRYRFGYVLASYAPLYDICHQGGIKESKFWNIFGTRYILGLLTKTEAEQLIQEPMQRALGRTFKGMREILTYSGYHPAFIQMVAAEYWNSHYHGFAVNTDAIQQLLYDYYQDLWQQRSETERKLLRQIANHETPEDSPALMNLCQRGLVDGENNFFARFFEQMVSEEWFLNR